MSKLNPAQEIVLKDLRDAIQSAIRKVELKYLKPMAEGEYVINGAIVGIPSVIIEYGGEKHIYPVHI